MTNKTRRTKSIEGFSRRALSVPRTGHSDINNHTIYNSTFNFYSEDEYLDLRIDFRFSLERGRRRRVSLAPSETVIGGVTRR